MKNGGNVSRLLIHGICLVLRLQEGDEEVKDLIEKVKALTGLSSDDPPDTEWVYLEKIDKNTGKKVNKMVNSRSEYRISVERLSELVQW